MRKISTLLLAFMLSVVASFAQNALFETNFATEADFRQWTVIDANGDGATWQFSEDAKPSKVFYNYSSANVADDWFVSPGITPTEDGPLMVQYVIKGGDASYESLEVYTGSVNTVDGMTEKKADHPQVVGKTPSSHYILVDAKAGQTFYLGFHCVSPADRFRLYLLSVKVSEASNPVDLTVDSIESPVSGKDLSQETVKVILSNKGLATASKFSVAFSVDGTEIAREVVPTPLKAGEQMEYSFNAKADLSIPRHLYKVDVYTLFDGDIAPVNDTLSTQVRHKAPGTVPYKMGFEFNEYTDDIKFYNLNDDSGSWKLYSDPYYNFARTGYVCLGYNYDKENGGNDWAILEPITITEAGDYALRFWYSGDDNHPEKLGVYWGNGDTPTDMTNKIVEYAPFARGAYEESVSILHFDKPQTVFFGFYAFSDKDENWLTIDDVSFYKIESDDVDVAVANLQRPFDYARTPNAGNAVFDLRNIGIKDVNAKVTIKVDDEVKRTEDVTLTAQEFRTVQASGVLEGLAEGNHTLKIYVDCTEDKNAANDTISTSFYVLGAPVKLYDFENGKIPSDFTFRTEDGGTIDPDAGDEWNEYGWGILPIGTHAMYGNYTFGGNSWIDGVDQADRWIIFPQVKVGQGDAFFVWDANSYNPLYREDYEVKVSDGSMEPKDYWYTTEQTVTSENTTPTTHGIDLSKYAGKDVYVAIRLTSKISEILVLDNIGFYGDVALETNGITSATTNATYRITDNRIVAAGAERIHIVDAGGRTVADVYGDSANTYSLASGVYVVTIQSSGIANTFKFVKK